jgi:membrane fusion protein (multidrug efflux system)
LFTEGAQVKKGDLLYQIDPAPYQAACDNASANRASMQQAAERAKAGLAASIAALKRHEATLKLAQTNLERYEKLVKTSAVSAMQRDQAEADVEVAQAALCVAEAQVDSDRESVKVAEAAIKQAEAAMETAKINLGYTKITAPITGRIGRSNITEGAIATAYQMEPLATIQQFDPIYIDVPQSTVELNRLRRSLANGRLKDNGTDKVKIVLEDGSAYSLDGSLQFRDVTVDPTTGAVILRIVVPNPDGTLLPGMFVRAIIEEGVREHAILVPQQGVSRDPKGNPLALIVDGEGKVKQCGLVTDRAIGDNWLVSSGLAAGDRVIVEGMQKARPGTPVKAVPFEAGGAGASAESTAKTASSTNRQ